MSQKINREDLLNSLTMVKAGLSSKEFLEQSSCYVFNDGYVSTFNDEIACRMKISLDVRGAVQADSLLNILGKISDEQLKVRENDKGELEFRGKRKGFGLTKDAEIVLPIERVEQPEKWRKIPDEFCNCIDLVRHCVSMDETKFILTCVHICPTHIEACNNMSLMRCQINTGLKYPVLVRGSSIAPILSLNMTEMAVTKSWLHFRNPAGLIFSCRKFKEEFPPLDQLIKFKGHEIVIPKGMAEASDRAAVFAADTTMGDPYVSVTLSSMGHLRLRGEGQSGWYSETRKVNYKGPEMEFLIKPDLLRHICEHYSNAQIRPDKLKVIGGHWEYVTVLGQHSEPEKNGDDGPDEDEPKVGKSSYDRARTD